MIGLGSDKNAYKKSIDTDFFLSFVSCDRDLSSCVEMFKKMVTPFVNDFVSNCRTPFVNPSNSVVGGIPILLVPSLQNSEQDEICFSTLENFGQNLEVILASLTIFCIFPCY